MKTINNNVFLNKIYQKIKAGEFDNYLNIPFMTKELLYECIKNKIERKIETGSTPILSDNEVKDCLSEVKETAVNIFAVYLKIGFIEKTENGYEMTEKMQLALKAAYRS